MKAKHLIVAFAVSGMLLAGHAQAADYIIDKKGQHAFVNFKVSHLGYSYIIGRFTDFDGKYSYNADNPAASKVNVTINAQSIDTNHAERDKHLRSGDFLDVSKNPTITFDSTSFERGADGDMLTGKLSMNGVTREVAIDVRKIGEGKDPWGGYRSGFQGVIVLNSSDWGLPDWVGDIEVELNIEGIRQDS